METKSCVKKRLIENNTSKTQCDLILLQKKHFPMTQTGKLRNTFGEHFVLSRCLTLRHAGLFLYLYTHTYTYINIDTHTHTQNYTCLHTDLLLLPKFHYCTVREATQLHFSDLVKLNCVRSTKHYYMSV